jgi:hypothetical protein
LRRPQCLSFVGCGSGSFFGPYNDTRYPDIGMHHWTATHRRWLVIVGLIVWFWRVRRKFEPDLDFGIVAGETNPAAHGYEKFKGFPKEMALRPSNSRVSRRVGLHDSGRFSLSE